MALFGVLLISSGFPAAEPAGKPLQNETQRESMGGITPAQQLTQKLAGLFSAFPAVRAIGLAGSQTSGAGDTIFGYRPVCLYHGHDPAGGTARPWCGSPGPSRADLNLTFWDLGDEWFDAETGIEVDVIYWDCAWIGEMLDRVLVRHEAGVGYTTCFWHTLRKTQVLYDPSGWLTGLVERADAALPRRTAPGDRGEKLPAAAPGDPELHAPDREGRAARGLGECQPPHGGAAGQLFRRAVRAQPGAQPRRETPGELCGCTLPAPAGQICRRRSRPCCAPARRRPRTCWKGWVSCWITWIKCSWKMGRLTAN